ncbi:MAG: aldehyde dehydrogenase family protein [Elusimicrobia bacterium]|nr:aldehyde dehydrogenase family protein [Elusimicrobiota bacterium]
MMGTQNVNVEALMRKAAAAAAVFGELDQAHTDRIVRAVFEAGYGQRVRLAKMAEEETGIGRWQDKAVLNALATLLVYEDIKDLKTVGVVSQDEARGIVEIAQPLGPILAVVPVTSPTATVLFAILIALKTRNPIIVAAQRGAARCSIEAAKACYEAALQEDAPDDCVQWVMDLAQEDLQKLTTHEGLALVLGGSSGNVPVYIERSADVPFAVAQICLSKLFDNGAACASERALVVESCIAEQVEKELKKRGACFLDEDQVCRLAETVWDRREGALNAGIVGKPAAAVAKLAGISAPADVALLVAPIRGAGAEHPLSASIPAPILAYYVVADFAQAADLCGDLDGRGGSGRAVSLFSNDEAKILKFASLMNAERVVVNSPAAQGALGGLFNALPPALRLGDGVTVRRLLRTQRVARRRVNAQFAALPAEALLDEKLGAREITTLYHRNS